MIGPNDWQAFADWLAVRAPQWGLLPYVAEDGPHRPPPPSGSLTAALVAAEATAALHRISAGRLRDWRIRVREPADFRVRRILEVLAIDPDGIERSVEALLDSAGTE